MQIWHKKQTGVSPIRINKDQTKTKLRVRIFRKGLLGSILIFNKRETVITFFEKIQLFINQIYGIGSLGRGWSEYPQAKGQNSEIQPSP